MGDVVIIVLLLLVLANLLLSGMAVSRLRQIGAIDYGAIENLARNQERAEKSVKEEISKNREEMTYNHRTLREEIFNLFAKFNETVFNRFSEATNTQLNQFDAFSKQLQYFTTINEQKADKIRDTLNETLKQLQEENSRKLDAFSAQLQLSLKGNEERIQALQTESGNKLESMRTTLEGKLSASMRDQREEMTATVNTLSNSLTSRMTEISNMQTKQFELFAKQINQLTQTNEQKLDQVRETVEKKLTSIQEDNTNKLEQMRATVDEKLHATLEKRLGESFSIVSERLEQVHKGLGEMQQLASGVGDLRKVLTNVKTRGVWGEMQLATLLEQVLNPDQYAANVATKRQSQDRVEFAIKLPGKDKDDAVVWLPIDAKFPQEDYQRLLDAQEQANAELAASAAANLEARIRLEAKTIRDKYIDPPNTTDFAIMFLPVEGLYAEVLRRPGLCESLQREYRVNITGPTTLGALLNSLQMGFRTLAIEKRSSEVWSVLGAVKTEFGKFGDILEKTKDKLEQASKTIDSAAVRSRAIERKLRGVQQLPVQEATELLGKYEDGEAENA